MRDSFNTLSDLIRFFLDELDQKFFSYSFLSDQKKRYNEIVIDLEKEFRDTLYGESAHDLERLCRDHAITVRHKLCELVKDRHMTSPTASIIVFSISCRPNTLVWSLSLLYAKILVQLGHAHGCESEVTEKDGRITFIISSQYLRKLSVK